MQWSLASHPIAKGIKCGFPPMETAFTPGNFHMLPGFFPNMDTPHRLAPFDLDPSLKGNRPDMEIAPPPGFMQDDIPFDYQSVHVIFLWQALPIDIPLQVFAGDQHSNGTR